MSVQSAIRRVTARDIQTRKGGTPVVMLTAYDAGMTRLVDPHVDAILVGDSVGMVHHAFDSTVPVTIEMMILHAAAVMRSSAHALVIVDLPFGTYEASPEQAFATAARVLKETGAGAVKLEGGPEMAETAALMAAAGIPVMAHIGLRPQRVHAMGGYKLQGKSTAAAAELVAEARAFEQAGAFGLLLEGIAIETAREITEAVAIPTIGIASGPHCAGQVLVIYDLLGMNPDFTPTFLKTYADGHRLVTGAVKKYVAEVKKGTFPAARHGFHRI